MNPLNLRLYPQDILFVIYTYLCYTKTTWNQRIEKIKIIQRFFKKFKLSQDRSFFGAPMQPITRKTLIRYYMTKDINHIRCTPELLVCMCGHKRSIVKEFNEDETKRSLKKIRTFITKNCGSMDLMCIGWLST